MDAGTAVKKESKKLPRVCERCQTDFLINPSRLTEKGRKEGHSGRFCSYKCFNDTRVERRNKKKSPSRIESQKPKASPAVDRRTPRQIAEDKHIDEIVARIHAIANRTGS